MSLSIHNELRRLALPETSGRKYPLSPEESEQLSSAISSCENSTFTLVNGITAIGLLIEQIGLHEEAFREVNALTFSQIGSLMSELSLMIESMNETKGEAEYVLNHKPEGGKVMSHASTAREVGDNLSFVGRDEEDRLIHWQRRLEPNQEWGIYFEQGKQDGREYLDYILNTEETFEYLEGEFHPYALSLSCVLHRIKIAERKVNTDGISQGFLDVIQSHLRTGRIEV